MTKTTNKTNVTGIDFFKADKALSSRTSEYFRCVLRKKEISITYAEKISALNLSITNLDRLEGSLMGDKIPEMKATYQAQIVTLEEERTNLVNEQARFELTECDKTFKKSLRDEIKKNHSVTDEKLAEAIAAWFDAYSLDVRNTAFVSEIIKSIGNRIDCKTMTRTNGAQADTLNVNNALNMIYAKAYNRMVEVGTIKPAQIPQLLRDKYAPKKKATKKNTK